MRLMPLNSKIEKLYNKINIALTVFINFKYLKQNLITITPHIIMIEQSYTIVNKTIKKVSNTYLLSNITFKKFFLPFFNNK